MKIRIPTKNGPKIIHGKLVAQSVWARCAMSVVACANDLFYLLIDAEFAAVGGYDGHIFTEIEGRQAVKKYLLDKAAEFRGAVDGISEDMPAMCEDVCRQLDQLDSVPA